MEQVMYEKIVDHIKNQWGEDLDPFWPEVLAFLKWQNKAIEDFKSSKETVHVEMLKLKNEVDKCQKEHQKLKRQKDFKIPAAHPIKNVDLHDEPLEIVNGTKAYRVSDNEALIRIGKIIQINSTTPHYYYMYNSLGRTLDTIDEILEAVRNDMQLPRSERR